MKNTVAIVGSHPDTSKLFDFDREDCDIWVFNEALRTDWCKRADGVFQIHKPVIWRSKTNRNDPDHYEWLKSQTESVIYMQDEYEDVPKSERYPMDEINERFPTMRKYFTSSVAYALALAIYKGYERMEVYGVEMETNTEYAEQRPGVAYWVGFADAMGIEVDFHSRTFFNAPLYGYDGEVNIPIESYEKRIDYLSNHAQGAFDAIENVNKLIDELLANFVKSYKTDMSNLDSYIMALGKNTFLHGQIRGANDLDTMYLERCYIMESESDSYAIVRQEYEGYMREAGKNIQKAQKIVNEVGVTLKNSRDTLNTSDNKVKRDSLVNIFKKELDKYQEALFEFGKLHGVVRESQRLLKEYDVLMKASGIVEKKDQYKLIEAEYEKIEVLS